MKGGRQSVRHEVKVTDEQNNQFAYQNFQSRSRLDVRLWLECRSMLVECLMGKVSGMGLTKGQFKVAVESRPLTCSIGIIEASETCTGNITKIAVEVRGCRQYCEEGIHESEACGDLAMLAQFRMQLVLFDLTEGADLNDMIPSLEVSTNSYPEDYPAYN